MILEFDGIQFGYNGEQLLSAIYMKCETGKVTGLLGRNGVGKTTLLQIAFGSLHSDTVSLRVDHRYIPPPAFTSRLISYLPQSNFLPDQFTLRKILQLCEIQEENIIGYFPEFRDELQWKAQELSGGRLRLFEVLLVLSMNTPFCFLDEPFKALAPVVVERLEIMISEVKKKKGILITDHQYWKVLGLADDKYLLTNGKTYPVKDVQDLVSKVYLLENQ